MIGLPIILALAVFGAIECPPYESLSLFDFFSITIYFCDFQATENRQLYFARKFDPSINQVIIDKVEAWLEGAETSRKLMISCF